MTERIGSWILSVACCGIFVSLIQSLLPKGAWSRIGQFAGGILMILAVAGPLVRFDADDVLPQLKQMAVDLPGGECAWIEEDGIVAAGLIIEEYRAYVLEQAQALGVSCQVEVRCREMESGLPIPEKVILSGELGEVEGNALSQQIAEKLGVTVELRGGEERR